MTELLYQRDSYLQRFSATVVGIDQQRRALALDRTAFYPGGGGQPCDLGMLGGLAVERVSRDADTIWHILAAGQLPEEGDRVQGRIDWDRRYLLMRTHSALHVLCGVVWRRLRAKVTGGNMSPGEGRLDFELEGLNRGLVEELESECNREIAAARPIEVRFLPRQELEKFPDLIRTKVDLLPASVTEIRIVEIVDLDTQADGGTHVAATSEIGGIAIPRYKSKGALNKRLYVSITSP
ncbi:MAG: alanyl-tRNA editing protein [Acidobacteriota bacterium]